MELDLLKILKVKVYLLERLNPNTVNVMTKMMEETIRNGTGRKARIDRPAAGKTGTSQSLRDAWFVGFTSSIVVGVWFGNDDDSPMEKITGGTAPAVLWSDFMEKAHKNIQPKALNYNKDGNSIIETKNKIKKIIEKSKANERKNVFESILDNFF